MRKLTILLALFLSAIMVNAQDRKSVPASVEKIEGMPVFIFSLPTAEYEVVGKALKVGNIIKIALNMDATVRDKAVEMVQDAMQRNQDGKVSDFDAIIFDLDKDKVLAIKFGEKGEHISAEPIRYKGVPVYLFSNPVSEYDVIADLEADYSLHAQRGVLLDKIESMINRTIKKEESGEVGQFDAVVINPDDLSEKLIKFK